MDRKRNEAFEYAWKQITDSREDWKEAAECAQVPPMDAFDFRELCKSFHALGYIDGQMNAGKSLSETFEILGGTPAPTSTEAALAEALKEQTPAIGGA